MWTASRNLRQVCVDVEKNMVRGYTFAFFVNFSCSYALLNTRNRKIRLLRIVAVYHFIFRVQKLDELGQIEDGTPILVDLL